MAGTGPKDASTKSDSCRGGRAGSSGEAARGHGVGTAGSGAAQVVRAGAASCSTCAGVPHQADVHLQDDSVPPWWLAIIPPRSNRQSQHKSLASLLGGAPLRSRSRVDSGVAFGKEDPGGAQSMQLGLSHGNPRGFSMVCAVCGERVCGLTVACCYWGVGGHLRCMATWFAHHSVAPNGGGHACSLCPPLSFPSPQLLPPPSAAPV